MAYKDDVTPAEAFQGLVDKDNAFLIDVRTMPEWNFVGMPAVQNLMRLEWQSFPSMQINPGFVDQVEEAGVPKDADVFLICRSGARSAAAAAALTAAGYENCYNVTGGFEGDKDENGHRGSLNGWKADGLPWFQG